MEEKIRKENHKIACRKYEKTKKGFLMRCYRNMFSRITGVQKKKTHLYSGKELLDKNSFYEWSLDNDSFNHLYNIWVKNNYNRKLTPSINRINSYMGYTINNIEWITHSENSRLGSLSDKRKEIKRCIDCGGLGTFDKIQIRCKPCARLKAIERASLRYKLK